LTALLEVAGLSKRFRRSGTTLAALDDVWLSVAAGETVALVGPSGSGKSTLARLVLRLIEPDSGSIRFAGGDFLALRGAALRAQRARLQMVFQDPLAAFNPRATVGRAIADPLRIHRLAPARERPAAVAALLARVGLPSALAGRRIHEISGGQRQRVAIARAIATRPALLVLDEALSALDVEVRAAILALLDSLRQSDGLAYLLISHDLGVVRAVAERIAILDRGRIVEAGPARAVIDNPRSATGRALVAAMPRLSAPPAEGCSP